MHEDVALDFAQWLSIDFKLWCNDRLKELLKTGKTELEKPQSVLDMLKTAVREIETKEKVIQIMKPKVELMERVLKTDDKIDVGQAAKLLNLPFGRNTLFKKLREQGVFFKNRNEPKQNFIERGLFVQSEIISP